MDLPYYDQARIPKPRAEFYPIDTRPKLDWPPFTSVLKRLVVVIVRVLIMLFIAQFLLLEWFERPFISGKLLCAILAGMFFEGILYIRRQKKEQDEVFDQAEEENDARLAEWRQKRDADRKQIDADWDEDIVEWKARFLQELFEEIDEIGAGRALFRGA